MANLALQVGWGSGQEVIPTDSGQVAGKGWKVPTARRNFPLPEEECLCQKKSVATARSLHYYYCQRETSLLSVTITLIFKAEDPHFRTTSGIRAWRETLILGEFPSIHISHSLFNSQKEMDHQYLTVAKIPVLDTRKFEQWQFRIQQYLQHEHYALWEVIEFGDSYKVPTTTNLDNATMRKDDEQSGITVTITIEDMQRKKNDVNARTTLLLSLPDEHQLRFSKYKTAKELWAAILKTFGEVEKDDLNKKFLTSLALKWLMHTIVWRNKNDLDTMSLDDLYNHLKVYEAEVQKKSNTNSQNMAFISSSKYSSGDEDGNTACVSTSSTTFSTASTYIASQSNGSQIKFEDINQIDEDDMKEMDIKWSMALLSMRADKFWKRTGKRISIQGSNVGSKAEEKTPKALMAIDGVGWDWSYMENEGEDRALVADAEAPTEFALMTNTESKVFDNSLCLNDCKKNNDSLNSKIKDLTCELSEANNYIYHYKLAVAQLEGRLVEYKEREVKYIEKIRTLEMYKESNLKCIKTLDKELETLMKEKDVVDGKLACLLKSSKDLENIIESQRSDKVKEGVGYNVVPPPAADLYLSPKKDLSWTGLPKFVDNTVTDYSRPSPTVASASAEGQNKNSSTSEDVASPDTPKPFVKFVKPKDSQSKSKTNKHETTKKPQVKYAEQYKHSNKKPNVKGNQRNWNNFKSYQLGPEFVLNKKACFNCGDFLILLMIIGKGPHGAPMRPPHRSAGQRPHGASMTPSQKPAGHRPHGPSMNPMRPNMNSARPNRSFFMQAHSYETRPFLKSSAVKFPTASKKFTTGSIKIHTANMGRKGKAGSSQNNIDEKGYWDSGCSRHMIGNISYLSDFEPFDGGYVSFGQGECKITGKGTIKTGKLEFENVYFVKDLKFNLFSVS
nr:ribonuclease H-like domain-containing protein [Tanacetum cinerariifolium]